MADNGVWVVGWEGDKRFFAGENVAFSIMEDKKTIYTKIATELYENGTFPSKLNYLTGLHDGGIYLSDFSSKVPQYIRDFVVARANNWTAYYVPQDPHCTASQSPSPLTSSNDFVIRYSRHYFLRTH